MMDFFLAKTKTMEYKMFMEDKIDRSFYKRANNQVVQTTTIIAEHRNIFLFLFFMCEELFMFIFCIE